MVGSVTQLHREQATATTITGLSTAWRKASHRAGQLMNHVTEDMLRQERAQILEAGQEDIRALADIVQTVLDAGLICVIGSEEKIEQQKQLFEEVRILS